LKKILCGIVFFTLLIATVVTPAIGKKVILTEPGDNLSVTITKNNMALDEEEPVETYEGLYNSIRIRTYWKEGSGPICIWLNSILPDGAEFDYSGKCGNDEVYTWLNWTPNYCQAGTYHINFLYGYGENIDQFILTIIVNNVNRAPTLEVDPDGPINVEPGETAYIDVRSHDPDWDECGDDLPTFECSDPDHFHQFDEEADHYYYEWETTSEDVGTYTIIIIVVDSHGAEYQVTIVIIIGFECFIDLDVVWQVNNNELVPDKDEDKPNVQVPGRSLSLNRGENCLKRMYVRETVPPNIDYQLTWTDKVVVYEGPFKRNVANKTYNGPREFWVEAIDRSTARNDQTVTAIIIAAPCVGTSDTVCFTNFEVEITVKIAGAAAVMAENDKSNAFAARLGVAAPVVLGLNDRVVGSTRFYGAAVEIEGQIVPNVLRAGDFFDDEFYWRQNYDERIYENGVITSNKNDVRDDPFLEWQDVTPSATGKIYYVDSPGDSRPAAGVIKAVRLRFDSWCTFCYHERPGLKGDATNDADPLPDCWLDCSVSHKWYIIRTTLDNNGRNNGLWLGNTVANGPNELGLDWEWDYEPPSFWLDYSVPSIISWIEGLPIIGKIIADTIAPYLGILLEYLKMVFGFDL
jgi:hypothetical protein